VKTKITNALISKEGRMAEFEWASAWRCFGRVCSGNHVSWRLQMLRFFLFMVCVMAASTSAAEEGSPCANDNTVPIQIMTPGRGGRTKTSIAEVDKSLPHFRAFVTAVTEHIKSRLTENGLCINDESMSERKELEQAILLEAMIERNGAENMESATVLRRSLLQFVHWPLDIGTEYTVPMMTSTGGIRPNCRITSPWIDLVIYQKPAWLKREDMVPQIRGIVRWNERQLLVDQAALAGAQDVPRGIAMPFMNGEVGHFYTLYRDTVIPRLLVDMLARNGAEIPPELAEQAAKPLKEQLLPELLWWASRYSVTPGESADIRSNMDAAMDDVTKKSVEGYTKLVITLIDRCFASEKASFHYDSILDVADPVLLEQYKVNTPLLH
jgi:hypothetical protein